MAAKSKKWTPARHAKFAATLAKKKAAVIGIDSPVPAPVTIRDPDCIICQNEGPRDNMPGGGHQHVYSE